MIRNVYVLKIKTFLFLENQFVGLKNVHTLYRLDWQQKNIKKSDKSDNTSNIYKIFRDVNILQILPFFFWQTNLLV